MQLHTGLEKKFTSSTIMGFKTKYTKQTSQASYSEVTQAMQLNGYMLLVKLYDTPELKPTTLKHSLVCLACTLIWTKTYSK